MTDRDGPAKNAEVVRAELAAWRAAMRAGLARFRHASLRRGKDNIFHLLQNLVTETYRALPRTLGYLTSLGLLVVALVWVLP